MHIPADVWSLSGSTSADRSKLIAFWLACPDDQLEFLWNSSIGEATTSMVKALDSASVFTPSEVAFRNQIGEFFNTNGLSHQLSTKLMLANFLVSPPGLLQINNIDSYFPAWLCNAYRTIYSSPAQQPLKVTEHKPDVIQSSSNSPAPQPDFGPFPSTLTDLVSNRIHLNRILGLSNLYYIDPDDSEITKELLDVRASFAELIIASNVDELEKFWATEIGERYWALVRSGIQKEPLSDSDQLRKSNAVSALNPASGGGFSSPKSINSFLVSMMYFLPGTMQVSNPEENLPLWLLNPYKEIFVSSVQAT